MSDLSLYPTPSRLAYLRECGRQTVFRLPSGESRLYFDDGSYRTVNGRVGELISAGWVCIGAECHGLQGDRRRWRHIDLTALGRAVCEAGKDSLEAAERARDKAMRVES